MSTPNAVSPLPLAVMSEQSRPPQGVLDAADVLDQIAGIVARENVLVAYARAHRNRDVAECVCGSNVGLGIADDDGRGVGRDPLAGEPRFLKRRGPPPRVQFRSPRKRV